MADTAAVAIWSVYLLRCADGSLYTGISTDVQRRLLDHRGESGSGKGAKALRGRQPLALVYQQAVADKSIALQLEYRIKQLSKANKERLIAGGLSLSDLLSGA